MNRLLGGVFLAAVVIVVGVFIAILFSGGKTIKGVLTKYEFNEIVPPSTLIPPGTIITVIKDKPLVVGIICPPSESLGSELQTKLLSSDSANSKGATELRGELTGEFKLDSSIQEQVAASADSKSVKNIMVTLSNVKVIEIPDSAVFELVSARKDACSKAMKFRREKGQKISMIKAVIQATALYRVQFDGSLNTDLRSHMTRNIATDLGLINGVKSDDTIEGDGLIWGVRDDMSLATIPTSGPPLTGAASHPRALPTGTTARVVVDVR